MKSIIRGMVASLLCACSAWASAQVSLPGPKASELPREPARSISEAALKKAAARHLPVAQWLLMRWYRDYQGFIKFDTSDPIIARFLTVQLNCLGDRRPLNLREALELKAVDPAGFSPRYVITHHHSDSGDSVGVKTNLTRPGIPAALKIPRLYIYEMGATTAHYAGAFKNGPDGKSLVPETVLTHGPLETLKFKWPVYCDTRDRYRRNAVQWINNR